MSPSHAYYLGCKYAFAQMTKTALMAEAQGAVTGLRHLGGRIANFFRGAPKNVSALQAAEQTAPSSMDALRNAARNIDTGGASAKHAPKSKAQSRAKAPTEAAPTATAPAPAPEGWANMPPKTETLYGGTTRKAPHTVPAHLDPTPRGPVSNKQMATGGVRRIGEPPPLTPAPGAPGAPGTPKAAPGAPEAGKPTSWGLPLAGGLGLGVLGSNLFNTPK